MALRFGLSSRIVLYLTTLLLFTGAILSPIFYYISKHNIDQLVRSNAQGRARAAASAIAQTLPDQALALNGRTQVGRLLEALKGDPLIAGIAASDIEGRPLAASGIKPPTREEIPRQKQAISFNSMGRGLTVTAPIIKGNQLKGAVRIHFLTQPAYDRFTKGIRLFVFYIILTLVLLIIITATVVYKVVIRPLNRMAEAAEEAAPETFGMLPGTEGTSETARLARSVNAMVHGIQEREQELEARVRELDRTGRELRLTQSDLIRAEKLASVGQLAAGVAHEVGNPLAAVLSYVGLMRDGKIPEEEGKETLKRVESELNRIHRIIRDLLDYSRPSEPKLGAVDLKDTIEASLQLLQPQERLKEIQIECSYQDGLPAVAADPSMLYQVLINLLLNAADAQEGCGRITIETATGKGGMVALIISDEGPGIAEENLEKIFEPFFTTKAPGRGTGLGLSICQRIVEMMGGVMEVRCPKEGGTRFAVHLKPAT